ncbi:MAG: pyruvate, phosphate dikinase [Pseudomonadota bacterium]|nr:pyruvate, phosphate dikinase [Pseudomonadota bacterium]
MSKLIYSFGGGKAEGNASMGDLLGGKGANLAEMSNIGVPVPPGFTISTSVCCHYTENDFNFPTSLRKELAVALDRVEQIAGCKFGNENLPLLVSVRSGARASMPGMMDTVLNLGLNDKTIEGLVESSGDERFAYDSYRRFIQMYSDVVLGVEFYTFEDILDDYKDIKDLKLDTELEGGHWREIVALFFKNVEEKIGTPFPQDPYDQLWGAIGAVFKSWMNERAKIYRRLHSIPEEWGTAVNVQSMVFGNMGDKSATGVCFTRNPSNGENEFFGEFLLNAQGEDVVAGIRTPQPLTNKEKLLNGSDLPSMEEAMPEIFTNLCEIRRSLENHYKDMQDIEFTVQKNKLWILQTRKGKRSVKAALKMAVEMVNEGLITKENALSRVEPLALDQLLHPALDPASSHNIVGKGLPASPGAASGKVVFSAEDAEKLSVVGEKVILVRIETSPEDIGGMHAAAGILTTRGGMTSHAAVVARGMGRPCVAGAGDVRVDYRDQKFYVGKHVVNQGDLITIDGSLGDIILGSAKTIQPELTGEFGTFMGWADQYRKMKVRTNAETPKDVENALKFGAEGIGLCRTEHMFFESDRIISMREMILSKDEDGRREALDKLLPHQRDDFKKIFFIMGDRPVTIRLLDPPLHEFLPNSDKELREVAEATGLTLAEVEARVASLHEVNPMLGLRGCRLGIMYPEIYEMQCRAIFEALFEVSESGSLSIIPEIMIPLVGSKMEFEILQKVVDNVASSVRAETGGDINYMIGTMIELPRAALQANEIAKVAQFFSFGTNDLTQTTYGLSRDDSGIFLDTYLEKGIFDRDPFTTIDQDGVGELIRVAVERGRSENRSIKLGICGEHGGDPDSIRFCKTIGLDYVSCSPYRVPIARLAAAQAEIDDAP